MTQYTSQKMATLLQHARVQCEKSQEYMAYELGIARRTVQNWEKGTTEPTLGQAVRWFEVLGISPLPYLFRYIYPSMDKLSADDDHETIRDCLLLLIKELPPEGVRQLMYLFHGDHGSSPRAILNLVTAHLQTPMKDRVTQAGITIHNYELALKKNQVTSSEHIQPNLALLKSALKEGEEAFLRNEGAYVMTEDKTKE